MPNVQKIVGKRGTSYRVQVMRNGKRIGRTFDKKRDADIFLSKLLSTGDLLDTLTHHYLATTPLSEAIRSFLDQHSGKDPSTIQRLNWWSDYIGHLTVARVSPQHVREGLRALEQGGAAAGTRNRYKTSLSIVFNWLAEHHDLEHNPAKSVKQAKEPNGCTRFLSEEEIPRLLQAAQAAPWPRMYLLVLMALTTAARRSELMGLRWADIDFTKRTASLHTSKNGEPRTLPLTDAVIVELERWREVGAGHVFRHPDRPGEAFEHFDWQWRAVLKDAGIEGFRFHDLRHSAASLAAMSGCSLLEIAELTGHKSLSMVKRYAHLCSGHKSKMVDRVFGGIGK